MSSEERVAGGDDVGVEVDGAVVGVGVGDGVGVGVWVAGLWVVGVWVGDGVGDGDGEGVGDGDGEGVGDDDGGVVAACNVDARPKKAMASSMERICTHKDRWRTEPMTGGRGKKRSIRGPPDNLRHS